MPTPRLRNRQTVEAHDQLSRDVIEEAAVFGGVVHLYAETPEELLRILRDAIHNARPGHQLSPVQYTVDLEVRTL